MYPSKKAFLWKELKVKNCITHFSALRIDHILITPKLKTKLVDVNIIKEDMFFSDYRLVWVELNCEEIPLLPPKCQFTRKKDIKDNSKWKDDFPKAVERFISENIYLKDISKKYPTINTVAIEIKNIINKAVEKIFSIIESTLIPLSEKIKQKINKNKNINIDRKNKSKILVTIKKLKKAIIRKQKLPELKKDITYFNKQYNKNKKYKINTSLSSGQLLEKINKLNNHIKERIKRNKTRIRTKIIKKIIDKNLKNISVNKQYIFKLFGTRAREKISFITKLVKGKIRLVTKKE